jgi:hypothetical protein
MKTILIILLISISSLTFSQNLVPNPSFEDYIYCPTNICDFSVSDWYRLDTIHMIAPSPDYFNSCASPFTTVSVPDNYFGSQYPYTGNAYIGMYTFDETLNYREIIWSELIDSLQIGNKYFINFKVSASEKNGYTNNIGILFSTIVRDLAGLYPLIENISHINITDVITDTVNWVEYSTSFIADSSYSYIYIGNFYDNSHTDTLSIANLGGHAYYYIDYICVSMDSLTCTKAPTIINSRKEKNESKIFPNPTLDKIHINIENIENIEIVDLNGIIIYSGKENEIDLSQYHSGIYYIHIVTDEKYINEKIIKQ